MLSDLFFTVNYSLAIVASIVSLTLCLLTISIVITDRQCRNFTNVLSCNTCTAAVLYSIFGIVAFIYGLRQDWQYHQPACIFRAYCSLALCTTLCYSHSIQAISRLFFAVFYRHKYLLTWRAHWILILANWIVSIIIAIKPLFHQNGFKLEIESRTCIVSPEIVSISIYVVIFIFVIPLNIVTVVYGVILFRVRQSTRRVMAFIPNVITNTTQIQASARNGKRELKLMQNMLTQLTIISLGGILYLTLVIWYATQQRSPPESFHLLSVNLISIFTAFMMIAHFLMNKKVKKIAWNYLLRCYPYNVEQLITHRPTPRFTVG